MGNWAIYSNGYTCALNGAQAKDLKRGSQNSHTKNKNIEDF